ncbi:GNAT family N-acetyltransferase [Streptomyces sp. NPDC056069]|uniref:GNAT family N-acetyltransferase n=1 Tax=Streptomyces sp. NPDC056069 TaxID=3345702 RepID=UPI0035D83B68
MLDLIDTGRMPGGRPAWEILMPEEAPGGSGVFVVCDERGEVAGAVRCAVRPADGAGLIVWLHSREDLEVTAALIALAGAHLADRPVLYACTGPATATGIPGLPVTHRPVTAWALAAAGFMPASAQRYFLRDLADPALPPPAYPLAEVTSLTRPPGWRLNLTDAAGRPLADATLHTPTPATGHMALLAALTVRPGQRRRGIGSHLLAQALHHAHTQGASRITTTVPGDDTAAARLLEGAGFLLLDTLTVYRRHP